MLPDEVSPRRRGAQIVAGILFCFTIAGLVFGFAALKPILADSGVYNHLCEQGEAYCKAQDTRLNFLFIVASSVNNVAALPMGSFLDRAGPKIASITGGAIFAAGCAVFSLGIVTPAFDTYLIGYILLALGAPAMFLAQFHLSNAFPARSGLILGALTGAFDASSLPLCFYKLAYFGSNGKPSIKTFFLCYMIIPILLIIQQLTFAPSSLYTRPPATTAPLPAESSSLSPPPAQLQSRRMSSSFSRVSYGVHDDADDAEVKEVLDKAGDGIVGAMFGKGIGKQVKSSWWWCMELMILIHMTRINWYLTTVNTQLVYYTHDTHLADVLTNAFIFLLPVGGILSIPAIGYLLDARPMLDVIAVMGVLGALFGAFTLASGTVPQLVGIGMLVIFRPLFYTAISDYAAKVFGFQTFGTVYGLAMTVSGLFGLILTPLDILTKGPLGGSYTPVNVTLLVLGVVATATLGLRVWTYTRKGQIKLNGARSDGVIYEEDEDEE